MPKPRKAAVISADIIGSSKMSAAERKKLQAILDSFHQQASKNWPDFKMEQYRGDSLQAIVTKNRHVSLRIGLMLQTALIKNKFGARLAIGVGEISYEGKNIITSDGSAFRASGPSLDVLRKQGAVIDIVLDHRDTTEEWWIHSSSLDYIIQHWTAHQAEAVYFQLQDYTQQEMARKLKIKQPSVHQRLQGAGWSVVQKILTRFESVVPSL